MSELLESLAEAIADEQEAQKKYKQMQQQAEDEKTRQLYEQLIEDEKAHEKILRSRYEALKENLD